jgi:hypothetical protein
MNLTFFHKFSKNPQISNFMKIHPVEADVFHEDGWTSMMKLTVMFCNFANMPKNAHCILVHCFLFLYSLITYNYLTHVC